MVVKYLELRVIKQVLLAALILTYATRAEAARNTPPPPSGKVIHLFGPGSVLGDIMPTAPGAASPGAPGAPAPAQNGQEPTMGDVLHQMFITGDPTAGPGFSNDRKITR